MKNIRVAILSLLCITVLSSCTSGQYSESESSESFFATDTGENIYSDIEETETFEKYESLSEESSETEEKTEESSSEENSEIESVETETEPYEPPFEEHGEVGDKLGEILTASYEDTINVVGSMFYFNSLTSFRYQLNFTFEEGKVFLEDDRRYYIMEYTEDIVLTLPDVDNNKDFEYVKEVLDKLNSQGCYVLVTYDHRTHFGKELAIYYLDEIFYVVKCYNQELIAIHRFALPQK